MKQRNGKLILDSAERLAKGEQKLREVGDGAWLFFLKRESSILLRLVIKAWLKLRFRR